MITLAKIYRKIRILRSIRRFSAGSVYGDAFQPGAYSLCDNRTGKKESIRIGTNCMIHGSLIVQGNGKLLVGNNTYIGGNTMIGAVESVKIGDNVIIAANCRVMDNNNHPTDPAMRKKMSESGSFSGPLWEWEETDRSPVEIDDNVWIGEFVSVQKGVHIGKGSVIGTHSVVTHDIPPYVVAAGVPAKVVKKLKETQ